ncbi:MAG: type II CAAX endopeptidase family protein [Brevefilum sp.]|nr:type II CAAX endopeptidase family protein [Brevefilum sp.]MDW7753868.1 type II CAAX endopeptidase family protein [Brevefilum sp.]
MFWRLLIFSLLLFGLMLLFSTLAGIINFTNASSMLAFVILLAVLSALLIAGKWIDRREITGFGLQLSKAWWQDFGFGLVLGALLMALIILTAWLTGNLQINSYFQKVMSNTPFIWQFLDALFFFICVGIYEELILRGYLLINLAEGLKFNWLGKKRALITALVISSLIFGVLHIVNPNASWISTLTISLAGVFLGLGLVLTGRLGLPIGLHITWNFFQGNVFGFPVSGSRSGVSLVETELTGPMWLTGGAFGPEAGVLGLLAMLIGCILILLWVGRRGKLALKKELTEY